jgi:hypothetical protein
MNRIVQFFGLALAVIPHVASAQDDTAINEAYGKADQGLVEFNAGHYAEALERYTQAFALVKLPALAVHMARSNVKLGHLVEAKSLYEQAMLLGDSVGDPEVQARARSAAEAEKLQLVLRIPKLVIRTAGAPNTAVTVQVDGVDVPLQVCESGLLVDPGRHQVIGVFGRQRQGQSATVAEGDVRALSLEFTNDEPPEAPISSPRLTGTMVPAETTIWREAAWVSLGVGGASLLVWGTTGIVAWHKSSELKSLHCGHADEPRCPAGENSSYESWRTAATVSFCTGVGAALLGAALYFVAPQQRTPRDSMAHVAPWVGINSAGIEGQF